MNKEPHYHCKDLKILVLGTKGVVWHRYARIIVALLLVAAALPTITVDSNPHHLDTARALLSGSVWIENPTSTHDMGFQEEGWFAPFPPLPAFLAVPVVFLNLYPETLFNILVLCAAVLSVFLAGRIGDRYGGRATGTWATIALGLGSGMWVATAIHDTYHSAHVLAVCAVTAAIYITSIRPRRPIMAGLLLGLGALARQPVVMAAVPLAAITGGRRRMNGRTFATVIVGAVLVFSMYLALNTARFGTPFETGYGEVQHHEVIAADIEADGVFSASYLPKNLKVAIFGLPERVEIPPWLVPDPKGMSMLLVSPWLVLALFPLFRPDRPDARRIAVWCWAAAVLISIPHMFYVNSGWIQFGYRFALDEMPFLLLAAVLGIRRGPRMVSIGLLAVSVVVNLWGIVALATWSNWSSLLH